MPETPQLSALLEMSNTKKPTGVIQICVELRTDIDFDLWKSQYAKTDKDAFKDEKEYEEALLMEWNALQKETGGYIDATQDGDNDVDDCYIEYAFDEYDCSLSYEEYQKEKEEAK